MTKTKKSSTGPTKTRVLTFDRVESPTLTWLKDEGFNDVYWYLVWIRRTSLSHVTSPEYQVAKGKTTEYFLKVHGLMPTPYEQVAIRDAKRILDVSKIKIRKGGSEWRG